MVVFNNQQRSGYEEIVSYSPRFYTKIKEMDAIFRFAGWTIDLMAADMEDLIAYQFINNMDKQLIERMEKFYNISPRIGSTLEERKRYLAAMYNSGNKMSASKLEHNLVTIIGKENSVNVSMPANLEIAIESLDESDKIYMMIKDYLDKVLPAHLAYDIIYDRPMNAKMYFGAVWQDDEIMTLRQVVV